MKIPLLSVTYVCVIVPRTENRHGKLSLETSPGKILGDKIERKQKETCCVVITLLT